MLLFVFTLLVDSCVHLARYKLRAMYSTFDVTEMLSEAENAVAVTCGGGHYSHFWLGEELDIPFPQRTRLWLQIDLLYQDGATAVIGTDGTWTVSDGGPITADSVYGGEHYDARLEERSRGWDMPGLVEALLFAVFVFACVDILVFLMLWRTCCFYLFWLLAFLTASKFRRRSKPGGRLPF